MRRTLLLSRISIAATATLLGVGAFAKPETTGPDMVVPVTTEPSDPVSLDSAGSVPADTAG